MNSQIAINTENTPMYYNTPDTVIAQVIYLFTCSSLQYLINFTYIRNHNMYFNLKIFLTVNATKQQIFSIPH